jgi:hypothetical protein
MADSVREIENLIYTYAARLDADEFAGLAPRIEHGPPEATSKAWIDVEQVGDASHHLKWW